MIKHEVKFNTNRAMLIQLPDVAHGFTWQWGKVHISNIWLLILDWIPLLQKWSPFLVHIIIHNCCKEINIPCTYMWQNRMGIPDGVWQLCAPCHNAFSYRSLLLTVFHSTFTTLDCFYISPRFAHSPDTSLKKLAHPKVRHLTILYDCMGEYTSIYIKSKMILWHQCVWVL